MNTQRNSSREFALFHFSVIFVLLLACLASQVFSQGSESPDNQIKVWVDQLGSDTYSVRLQATRSLARAGTDAYPQLLDALVSSDQEIRARALHLLTKAAESKESEKALTAIKAISNLAESDDRHASKAAKDTLSLLEQRAASHFASLGAEMSPEYGPIIESINLSSKSQVTDEDVMLIRNLRNLHTVILRETQISDRTLANISHLKKLQTINLFGTKVTSDGMRHLSNLPNVSWLSVESTAVDDRGIPDVVKLKTLRHLFLGGSKATGECLRHVAGLQDLTYLNLRYLEIDEEQIQPLQKNVEA